MKQIFKTYAEWLRLAVGAVLIAAALIISGFIHLPYVPVGCLLVILVNWLLFRSEKQDLSALGFDFKTKHLILIPIGLLLGAVAYLLSFYAGALVRGDHIEVVQTIDFKLLLRKFWWVLPTAAVQDFMVVGYCYYKLIRLTNVNIATVLFGLFFICLHDVWGGNLINSLFYAATLLMGYLMFSSALLRSGSIWLVIGLHWGNNFVNSFLFTFGQKSTSWLYIIGQQRHNLSAWQGVGLFAAFLSDSLLVILLIRLFWKQKKGFSVSYSVTN